jgi:hypothetical protein
MKKITKMGLVILGFIVAFSGAFLAAYLDGLLTERFQAQSGGMVAGGQMILFIGVFAVLSLFPIGLALFFLRSEKKFWSPFSIFAVGLALTGPMAEAFMTAVRAFHFWPHSGWAIFIFINMLEVFGTPVFAFGFFLFAFISPLPQPRKRLLIAAGIEMALFFYICVHLLFWHNYY